jgi:hypothetical protein
MIRTIVRPITILAKVAARSVHHSICEAVFVVEAAALAAAAMAKAASNTSKLAEVVH